MEYKCIEVSFPEFETVVNGLAADGWNIEWAFQFDGRPYAFFRLILVRYPHER